MRYCELGLCHTIVHVIRHAVRSHIGILSQNFFVTGARNIAVIQFHKFLDRDLIALGIHQHVGATDSMAVINVYEYKVGLVVTVSIIGYDHVALVGGGMTNDAHTVLLKARHVVIVGVLVVSNLVLVLVAVMFIVGRGIMVMVVLNVTCVVNRGHVGGLDMVGIHVMGRDLGTNKFSKIMLLSVGHSIPFLGIIGVENATVPMEDATRAHLGACSGEGFGEGHVITHVSHFEMSGLIGSLLANCGLLASNGLHAQYTASTHQDTGHATNGHGFP